MDNQNLLWSAYCMGYKLKIKIFFKFSILIDEHKIHVVGGNMPNTSRRWVRCYMLIVFNPDQFNSLINPFAFIIVKGGWLMLIYTDFPVILDVVTDDILFFSSRLINKWWIVKGLLYWRWEIKVLLKSCSELEEDGDDDEIELKLMSDWMAGSSVGSNNVMRKISGNITWKWWSGWCIWSVDNEHWVTYVWIRVWLVSLHSLWLIW